MERKPLLNKRMKNDRLELARRYSHWGVEQLKKVIFSDESHFELRLGNQSCASRRSVVSARFHQKFTRKEVKHSTKVKAFPSAGGGGVALNSSKLGR
jgi:hypothetical protein